MIIKVANKFRKLLDKQQKKKIIFLVFLMIIGGFFEMMSVALILPFVEAMTEPEKITERALVQRLYDLLSVKNEKEFLVIIAIFMAALFIIKNVYLLIEMLLQNKYVYSNMLRTQRELLHSYLMRPYSFFLDVQSGEIIRVVGDDTTQVFRMLGSMLSLFTETIVSISLVLTVLIISPLITLAMGIFLSFIVLLVTKIIRPILEKSGVKNRKAFTTMNQWVMQSVHGIKEVKICNKEDFFEDEFQKSGQIFVKTAYNSQTFSLIPRFLIEASAMSVFFIAVAVMIINGSELSYIAPIISSVAMAAVRLLPSANRIAQAVADLSFRAASLDKVIEVLHGNSDVEILDNKSDVSTHCVPLNERIELRNITFCYNNSKQPILQNANLCICKGESVGIIGKSGAGKSTTLDILLGLLEPQGGEVLVDNRDIKHNRKAWLRQIGFIPQNIYMFDGTIRSNIAFGIPEEQIDDNKIVRAVKLASLEEFISSLPEGINTEIGERGIRISGGQRQRIGIARALYSEPEVLFFDEATSALDNVTEREIMEAIDFLRGKKTMILVSHRLTTLQGCDHVFKVENGSIQEATI